MRLEQFFEKFELFADAPNAVAKMREMVLQLAVSGRLFPQMENPDGVWRRAHLGEVARLRRGYDLPTQLRQKGNIPIYAANGTVGTHAKAAVKGPGVVTGRSGSIGKVHYVQVDYWPLNTALYVENFFGNDPQFVCLLLRSLHLEQFSTSTAVPTLNRNVVHKEIVSAPPLAEQKRIVAKVDELMALCDRLEAQQQERDARHAALARASLTRFAEAPTPANLDFLFHQSYPITPADLRKAILNLAVQGKLVPQDANDEPAFRSFLGLKPLASESNENMDIPDQWNSCTYRSVTSLVTSGSRGWKEFYSETGAIFVRTQNIKTDRLVLDDVAFVDLPKSAEGMRAQVLKDDILITITGANVTKAARVKENIPEAYVSQHIALTRPRWSEMSQWLHLCFISHGSARGVLEQLAYGDKPGLNLTNIRDLVLPIPPLAEQRRIVAKVDQLMAMVDQLEARLAEAKAKSTALLDAVIHELLNPTAEIVDLAAYRAAMACYAIRKMASKPYFGRTAAMKLFYLAQAHVGLELGLKPVRDAAGPLDQWIYDFEREGAREDWFRVAEGNIANGKTKIAYQPGRMLGEQSALAARLLSASQRKEYDRLLSLFADRTTEEAEIIATLFAAWNDFLIDGQTPGDDRIVTEVREHWHEKKARFTASQLRQWLAWLRQNNLVPTGRPPHTVHQAQLLLN